MSDRPGGRTTGDAPRGRSTTYADAGVDIDDKSRLLADLTPTIAATHTSAVAAGIGAFAGALRLDPREAGLLVATVDGVGTKTLLARRLGRDDVIGADIVAHCANDLIAVGARPVAFLDYIAMARLDSEVITALIQGMTDACRSLGVALLGGETAEMPDVYIGNAYDVVGTMIGLAGPQGLITGAAVKAGDGIIGLASMGLHTNGYSLARSVIDGAAISLPDPVSDLGTTAGEALLAPHRCYAPSVLALWPRMPIHALAHITGGGLIDNLTRVLPEGCRARLVRQWPRPPVFPWLQQLGGITNAEMLKTFNLGVGMAVIVSPDDADTAVCHFEEAGISAFILGEIMDGPRGVDPP